MPSDRRSDGPGTAPSRRGSSSDPLANLWDDAAFRAHVRELAQNAEIGLGELARAAGISEPWFRHAPKHGRNVDAILRVASILNVDFEDLIRSATMGANAPRVRNARMASNMAAVCDLAAHTYVALARLPGADSEKMIERIREIANAT